MFSSVFCKSQAIITGFINDTTVKQIQIFEPINGFCNNRHFLTPKTKVILDKSRFKRKINITSSNFIVIKVDEEPFYLFIEPRDTIDISINLKDFSKETFYKNVSITGKNSAGNLLLNHFDFYPGYKFGIFSKYLDSLQYTKTFDVKILDTALNLVYKPFDSLFKLKKVTKEFNTILREQFYGVLITVQFRNYLHNRLSKNELKVNLDFLNNIYNRFPISNRMLTNGIYSSSIAFEYFRYLGIKKSNKLNFTDTAFVRNRKVFKVYKDFSIWFLAPSSIAQYHWAKGLIGVKKSFPLEHDLKDRDAFLAVYPNSFMKKYLTDDIFEDKISTLKIDTTAIVFLKDDKINTFDSLISKFKGQNIFVDFWATWCFPCRTEFADYNKTVDSFCEKHNIKRLYLAFEKLNNFKNFRHTVYAYNLKGSHFIVNNSSIENDLVRLFYDGEKSYNLPHFALIDTQGKILNSNAPRLGETNKLFAEMILKFNLKE
jgi:thiol-disulfide isomerase/thioredoxin